MMIRLSNNLRPHIISRSVRNYNQRRNLSLTSLYAVSTDLFTIAHGNGVPWILAIPLTTIGIKYGISKAMSHQLYEAHSRSYMSKIYRQIVRNITSRKISFDLVSEASARPKVETYPMHPTVTVEFFKFFALVADEKYLVRIGPSTVVLFILQGFTWLLFSDTLRYMLGANLGLLSWIYPSFLAPINPQAFLEPSLFVEGFPWCTLAEQDPTFMLPLTVAATMTYSIVTSLQNVLKFLKLPAIPENSIWTKYHELPTPLQSLVKFSLGSPIWFGLSWLISSLPSGLLLYWASSAGFGLFYQRYMSNGKSIKRIPEPCAEGYQFMKPLPTWLIQSSANQIGKRSKTTPRR